MTSSAAHQAASTENLRRPPARATDFHGLGLLKDRPPTASHVLLATFAALATRSAPPGMESLELEALEERWPDLRGAATEDVFQQLAVVIRQALAQTSPESEGEASD